MLDREYNIIMAKKKKYEQSGVDSRFQIMMQAVMLEIKPEDYAEFYEIVHAIAGNEDADASFGKPVERRPVSRECGRKRILLRSDGMKDAPEKTLKLRVQMQDVTKPPMWRELKVPADFTFFQLHKAIQGACGFEDAHLWQFQRRPYDPEIQIGVPSDGEDPYEPGLDEWTHDARTTGITTFLAEKGQKLVYVYDFGDDWIFTVSVVDVTPRDGEVAECTRWKSDLQPLEDSGGIWSYLNMRQAWAERDSLTKRKKKDLADMLGYESFEQIEEIMSESMFDPERVNEILAGI